MNWKSNFNKATVLWLLVIGFTLPVKGEKLIDAATLNAMLGTADVKVLDVRPADKYLEGHIPGALQVWRPDFSDQDKPYEGIMASFEQMEKLLGKLGIKAGDKLVLYDDKALCDAARLWWILDHYDYPEIQLLNGGWTAWKSHQFEISKQNILPLPSDFYFTTASNDRLYARLDDVKRSLSDPGIRLVDTRSKNEFLGYDEGKHAKRKGRIPGSINIDWEQTVHFGDDHTFKSTESLKKLYREAGILPNENLIIYCRSGVRSAHTTFVLTQLLGYQHVKNYDGSWIEWSYHEELPIETGQVLMEASMPANVSAGYLDIFRDGYVNYANYLWHEITHPGWHNYFYWLLIVSAFFFLVELFFPWRKNQKAFRKDFWLDFFYMFFNFFLFSLIIYNAASDVVVNFFNNTLASIGINNLVAFEVQSWPMWAHLLLGFVVRDFVQWWIHRLLHRVPFLWEFHKVHHSVEEMGFAAHLRFHWMENIVYRSIEYIPLALIGIGLRDFFIIHIFTLAIGHWNHSNFRMNIGPLKYIFNNPQMHIWHHAYQMPADKPYGVNFGLTLSVWDYLFKTNYIPHDGRDIQLGFPEMEKFPHSFIRQNTYGFIKIAQKKEEKDDIDRA